MKKSYTLYEYMLEKDFDENILLFAEGGNGKSTQMIYAYNRIISDYSKKRIIPFFIDVKLLNNNIADPVFRYLCEEYCGKDVGGEENDIKLVKLLLESDHNIKYLFFIDGLNETANKNHILEDIKRLLSYNNCRVVVTSRVNEDQYIFEKFKKLQLSNVSHDNIVGAIEKRYNLVEHIDICKVNDTLIEILGNPLFLKTFYNTYGEDEVILKLYSKKTTRQSDILFAFVKKLLAEIKNRTVFDENSIIEFIVLYFIPRLAFLMVQQESFVFFDNEFLNELETDGKLGERYFKKLLSGKERGKYIADFLSKTNFIQQYCCNLSLIEYIDSSDIYRFSHQIWRDFFAAIHISNLISKKKTDELTYLPNETIRLLVGEIVKNNEKCECDYADKSNIDNEVSPIECFMQENYTLLNDNPVVIKNLIEIMKTSRDRHITACFDNLNLKYVDFNNCDISYSSFKNAVICEKNFHADGHSGYVYDAVITPDNKKIVSCGKDHSIRVWDIQSNRQVGDAIIKNDDYVVSIDIIDNNTMVAASYDRTIKIWNIETKEKIGRTLVGHTDRINEIHVTSDKKYILSCSNDQTVRIWSVDKQKQVGEPLQGHTSRINCICSTQDGKYIITGGDDCCVRIWDFDTHKQICNPLCGHENNVRSVCTTTDDNYIVSSDQDGKIIVWDFKVGIPVGLPLVGHRGSVESLVTTPDGKLIISAGYDGYIIVWDIESMSLKYKTSMEHNDWINSINISEDGNYIVSAGGDQKVILWDTDSMHIIGEPYIGSSSWINSLKTVSSVKKFVREDDAHSTVCYDFIKKEFGENYGEKIVSGGDDGIVRIWNVRDGRICSNPLYGHTARINAVDVTPDGRIITAGDDTTIKVWDSTKGILLITLYGHTDWVRTLNVTVDGKFLISGGWDKKICIWSLKDYKLVHQLYEHTASVETLKTTSDGKYLVSGSDDGTIRRWDICSGKEMGKPIVAHNDWIRALAMSADDSVIISASWDNTIKLWDFKSGDLLRKPLIGHKNKIDALAITKNKKYVVSGSDDNTVRSWNVKYDMIQGIIASHNNAVSCIGLAKDDQYVVSGDGDGKIYVSHITDTKDKRIFTQLNFNGYYADMSNVSSDSKISDEFRNVLYQNGCIINNNT